MPHGQDQNNVFCGKPTVLSDIPVMAARENELPPTILGSLPKERMIGRELERFRRISQSGIRPRRILGAPQRRCSTSLPARQEPTRVPS